MILPQSLIDLEKREGCSDWIAALPGLVCELTRNWNLELGDPFAGSSVSLVLPARRENQDLVLKIQWPHRECLHEADALQLWNGNGAVRLLEHDRSRSAMLLERCCPGTMLADANGTDPVVVLTDLLPRLWIPADNRFPDLQNEAALWRMNLASDWERSGQPCERQLVDAALRFIDELAGSQGEQVLLHQDLHGHNILLSDSRGWLAIDPMPLRGEREFSLSPIVRSMEFGHSREHVLRRLDELSSRLVLDRERARKWTIVQTMAWSFESSYMREQHQTVRWLLGMDCTGNQSFR